MKAGDWIERLVKGRCVTKGNHYQVIEVDGGDVVIRDDHGDSTHYFCRQLFKPTANPPKHPAPEGCEFTGEYRLPKSGELFMDTDGTLEKAAFDFGHNKHWILRRIEQPTKEILCPEKLPAPQGWEHVNECREPLKGERWATSMCGYRSSGEPNSIEKFGKRRWILRKIEEPKPTSNESTNPTQETPMSEKKALSKTKLYDNHFLVVFDDGTTEERHRSHLPQEVCGSRHLKTAAYWLLWRTFRWIAWDTPKWALLQASYFTTVAAVSSGVAWSWNSEAFVEFVKSVVSIVRGA